MWLIALALQSSGILAAASTAEAATPPVTRTTLRRSARPSPPTSPLLSACDMGGDCSPATSRFRLTGAGEPLVDRKLEIVHANDGPRCGLMGMPVCPGSGHRLLRLVY